jgi:curved DNA-binding protein CbpA
MDGRRARIVLGVAHDAGPAEIRRAFRTRAQLAHPDHGGPSHAFAELVDALAALTALTALTGEGADAGAPARRRALVAAAADRPRFDAYDSPARRPAPRRTFADALHAATLRLG